MPTSVTMHLPMGDVRLARGRRLRHRGPSPFPQACDREHGMWQSAGGLTVLATVADEPEIGLHLHVSLSVASGTSPSEEDVAEVALAFFPNGVDAFRAGSDTVVHLVSDERAQAVVGKAAPVIRERIDQLLGIRSGKR